MDRLLQLITLNKFNRVHRTVHLTVRFCYGLGTSLLLYSERLNLKAIVPNEVFRVLLITISSVLFSFTLWLGIEALKMSQRGSDKFIKPPGSRVLQIAQFCYSRKKYERIFLQTAADMREEYFEACSAGQIWKARWVHVRGVWSFYAAVLTDIPLSVVGLVVKLWIAAK